MDDDPMTWQIAAVLIGFALVFGLVIVVTVWQISAAWRARVSATQEKAYRELAEETSRAAEATARELAALNAAVKDLQSRTAELERLLKEVG